MSAMFIGGIVVFVLAAFVGLEVISKVPPTLHTPLMSGANAISGITIVGAVAAAGVGEGTVAAILCKCVNICFFQAKTVTCVQKPLKVIDMTVYASVA